MSEHEKNVNKYEERMDDVRRKINDLSIDNLAYASESPIDSEVKSLVFGDDEGHRVILDKVLPSAERGKQNFLQDWKISIHPGADKNFPYQQVDYNYNQFGDNELRKRIIAKETKGAEAVPEIQLWDSEEKMAIAGMQALFNANEMVKNMELEEKMGLNNQPVTLEEMDELISILDSVTVLDPRNDYKRVE